MLPDCEPTYLYITVYCLSTYLRTVLTYLLTPLHIYHPNYLLTYLPTLPAYQEEGGEYYESFFFLIFSLMG